MTDAPEATPEEEPVAEEQVEPELAKTGAEVWKERRALILSRNSAARERGQAPSTRSERKRPRG